MKIFGFLFCFLLFFFFFEKHSKMESWHLMEPKKYMLQSNEYVCFGFVLRTCSTEIPVHLSITISNLTSMQGIKSLYTKTSKSFVLYHHLIPGCTTAKQGTAIHNKWLHLCPPPCKHHQPHPYPHRHLHPQPWSLSIARHGRLRDWILRLPPAPDWRLRLAHEPKIWEMRRQKRS